MWRQRGPGAPRRLKTYSAESGYVWEYFFTGQDGATYRFEASATRKDFRAIAVEVDRPALRLAAQREMGAVEEYAVAKMSLLRAFDRYEPDQLPCPIRSGMEDFREILRTLDLL
jgi:hypothetical protein